ncbi:ABC transporter permease [Paenibacillus sp. 1011MAR3C5]|uniref:ABC transporter permease n=1 Tax=Paenibacillus sp. 1011MAR3C5 TaxID=1675787 RepID=UPI000E6C9163|nr:ABC transporter permease [Paenibacillus sp. 1011MAR3C5]RJE86170.1 ABC transporter permease [Paenibacillus sp. 1011MAR3C5]
MRDTIWLIRRTALAMLRSYKSLLLYLLTPIIGIGLAFLIYSGSGDVSVRIGVVNQDGEQPIAADVIDFLDGISHVERSDVQEEEARALVLAGELDAAAILPSGFSAGVKAGKAESPIELVALEGSMAASYMRSYLDPYIGNLTAIGMRTQNGGESFDTVYAKYKAAEFQLQSEEVADISAQRDMTNRAIGYLIIFMMFSAVNLSAFMIKEKENRTYFRVLASPVSAKAYVASNVAVNMLVLLVQMAIMLVVMIAGFGIEPGLPLWQLVAVLLLFAWVAVALSLVIIAFASNSMAASAMQNTLIITTCLLAGCMFPIDAMPQAMRMIADFLPQRWLLDTISKLQQGTAIADLSMNLLTLLAFAVTFSLLAIYKFGHNKHARTYV